MQNFKSEKGGGILGDWSFYGHIVDAEVSYFLNFSSSFQFSIHTPNTFIFSRPTTTVNNQKSWEPSMSEMVCSVAGLMTASVQLPPRFTPRFYMFINWLIHFYYSWHFVTGQRWSAWARNTVKRKCWHSPSASARPYCCCSSTGAWRWRGGPAIRSCGGAPAAQRCQWRTCMGWGEGKRERGEWDFFFFSIWWSMYANMIPWRLDLNFCWSM